MLVVYVYFSFSLCEGQALHGPEAWQPALSLPLAGPSYQH